MKLENTKAQMRKGILEFCILSILHEKEAYPSEIIEALKDAKLIVVEGTLYPLLTRLKNAELLSYRWEESNQDHLANTTLSLKWEKHSWMNYPELGKN